MVGLDRSAESWNACWVIGEVGLSICISGDAIDVYIYLRTFEQQAASLYIALEVWPHAIVLCLTYFDLQLDDTIELDHCIRNESQRSESYHGNHLHIDPTQ